MGRYAVRESVEICRLLESEIASFLTYGFPMTTFASEFNRAMQYGKQASDWSTL